MSQSKKRRGPEQLELPFDAAAPAPQALAAPVVPAHVAPLAAVREAPAPVRASTPAATPVGAAPAVRPGLRVIQGGGQRAVEALDNRNAVVRVLLETGADLLLKRISPVRAEAIEQNVNKILGLFDRVDQKPELMPVLRRELDELEALMAETRAQRTVRRKA